MIHLEMTQSLLKTLGNIFFLSLAGHAWDLETNGMIKNIFSTLIWHHLSFSEILSSVMGGSRVYRVRHSLISFLSTRPDSCPHLFIKFWWGTLWVELALYIFLILSFQLHSCICHHKILVTSSVGADLKVDSLSLSWSISPPNGRGFLLKVSSRS